MMGEVLDDIVSYKKSAAVIAAIKMDIFSIIYNKKTVSLSLCEEKGWNPDYFFLLLEYLTEIGYLKSVDKKEWSLAEGLESQISKLAKYAKLVKHESNIWGKWISPETIIHTIKSGSGERTFDLEGFTEEEKADYEAAVYENSSTLIGFQILRKLRAKENLNVVEFGRTREVYKELLLKRLSGESHYSNIHTIEKLGEMYDAVIMTNTVHYYTSGELLKVLKYIKERLNTSGFLCITDLFADVEDDFSKSLCIDWLTHGGVYNLFFDSVLSALKKAGYQGIEKSYLENISTYIIFAYK